MALAHAAPAGLKEASTEAAPPQDADVPVAVSPDADVPREGPKMEWDQEDPETRAARAAQEEAQAPLDEDEPPMDQNAMSLPGRHPAVEKELDEMAPQRRALKEKKMVEEKARGELQGSVTQAVRHMNDGMGIKQQMAKKEAQLRVEGEKIHMFEADTGRLEKTRQNLMESLHRIMDTKLAYARARFEKKEQVKQKDLEALDVWKNKKDQLKTSAIGFLKAKESSHASLLQAEEAVAEAQRRADIARKQYEYDRQMASREIQSFRYAETRYKAELTHEQSAEVSERAAKESVDKLTNILSDEERKVDETMTVKREHLQKRIEGFEKLREKSGKELEELEHQYSSWQEQQRSRAHEVAQQKQQTEVASQAFAEGQKEVLDTAQQKVVQEAEKGKDWAWGEGEQQSEDYKLELAQEEAELA